MDTVRTPLLSPSIFGGELKNIYFRSSFSACGGVASGSVFGYNIGRSQKEGLIMIQLGKKIRELRKKKG